MELHEIPEIPIILCGFCCAAKTLGGPPKSDVSKEISLRGTFQVDSLQQYGQRDNVRISGVIEKPGEVVHRKMVHVAHEGSVAIRKEDTSICHRLYTRKSRLKSIIAKFVKSSINLNRKATKKMKRNRGKLQNIDNITPLRGNFFFLLRERTGNSKSSS